MTKIKVYLHFLSRIALLGCVSFIYLSDNSRQFYEIVLYTAWAKYMFSEDN